MNKYFKTYIDLGFLIEMGKMRNSFKDNIIETSKQKIVNSLLDLIFKKSKIELNTEGRNKIDDNEIAYNKEYTYLRILLDNCTNGTNGFGKSKGQLRNKYADSFIKEKPFVRFVFYEDKHAQNSLSKGAGIFVGNHADTLKFWEIMYSVRSIPISSKVENSSHCGWSFLKEFKHPINALVLSDRYILSEKKLAYNLYDILSNLLPVRDLNVDIDVAIIVYDVFGSKNTINDVHKDILDKLRRRGLRKVNLSIIKTFKKFENHDRFIFTNYFAFNCGNSFNCFQKGQGGVDIAKVETIFYSFPLTAYDMEKTYFEAHKHLLEVYKNIVNYPKNEKIGNGKNRLYDSL
jgi:hypothetical protein